MSFKVALLAIVALFSATNAALVAVDLVAQSALAAACTTPAGCGLVNVILSASGLGALTANGLLDFSAYTGVTINFDSPLLNALTIGEVAVNGTGNVVNFATGTTVNTLVIGASSSVVVSGSSTVKVNDNVEASGAIVINAGATLQVATGAAGVIYQRAANLTVQAGGTVNSGINVASGAAAYIGASAAANAQAAVVSGGVIINGAANFGTATFQGAVVAGSEAAASAQANIAVTVSAAATFQSTFTASAQATVTVNAGAAILAAGNIQSQGAVVVSGAINTTSATANYVQQASSTASATVASNLQLNGGSVNVAAGANIQIDGTLSGQGTLTGTLTGSGNLNIGNSPGTVFVRGDYKPGAAATFNLEIASDVSYDKLVVSGAATLNGNLRCLLLGGYNPGDNSRYTFLTAQSVTGRYLTVTGEGSNVAKWTQSTNPSATAVLANFNSAVSVAVSGLLVVVCLLASLL